MKDDLYPMISVEEAQQRILSFFHPLEPEDVPILAAAGRVLAEDVASSLSVPPHDNTAMDGYAVIAADTAGAGAQSPVQLRVIFDLAAGYTTYIHVLPGTCIRIMTGAPMPAGADAVVPFEETDESSQPAGQTRTSIRILKAARPGANIRRAGEDIRQGEVVLAKGAVLRPPEIGVLASIGIGTVKVIRRPRVAILATGDELAEPGERLAPGQIYNSNNYTIAAAVQRAGGIPIILGIARDRIDDITAKIHAARRCQGRLPAHQRRRVGRRVRPGQEGAGGGGQDQLLACAHEARQAAGLWAHRRHAAPGLARQPGVEPGLVRPAGPAGDPDHAGQDTPASPAGAGHLRR